MVGQVLQEEQRQLPWLENGDRLSRPEFERRYAAMAQHKKAELIEGVVYMASPLRFQSHAQPHANMIGWLWTYSMATFGVKLGIEPTLRLDLENEPQPDGVLLMDESVGGRSRITADDYIEGAPELVVEIAASSASYDFHDKKLAYERNGIQEYIIWQILEHKVDWFELREGKYVLLQPDDSQIVRSQVFPGLWLASEALLAQDMIPVVAVLQEGLSSPQHADFVQLLQNPI
ncbi:MAG: Uma2 family endonuclease [Prochloron sp. SP5CPC1]|nr:Uma2 family endonuclease [Candidatus Paraprochloron terpiosi SP5CPC1]